MCLAACTHDTASRIRYLTECKLHETIIELAPKVSIESHDGTRKKFINASPPSKDPVSLASVLAQGLGNLCAMLSSLYIVDMTYLPAVEIPASSHPGLNKLCEHASVPYLVTGKSFKFKFIIIKGAIQKRNIRHGHNTLFRPS